MAQKKSKAVKKKAASGPVGWIERRPLLTLAALVIIVYGASVGFGYTKLDDTIFIQDYQTFNEDLGNLFRSFGRGVFHETKDTYYRPLFLDAMIINHVFSGQHVAGYHLVNILLHLAVVLLLFKFLVQIGIRALHAFILTAFFAIHPVLVQNVVWIPGRNDTILACFFLLFLLKAIAFTRTEKMRDLGLSFLWLLCAYFTKETAVFAPIAAFLVLVLILRKNWNATPLLKLYGSWVVAFGIWYIARRLAAIVPPESSPGDLLSSLTERLPVLVQYLGKVFLPVNLSVFPIMEDTSYIYGIAAVVLLSVLVGIPWKMSDKRTILAGLLIFVSFLIPVFLVPSAINTQTFEHRLYLPMIGMVILLSQTVLFLNSLRDRVLLMISSSILVVLIVLNAFHQRHFTDELSFWTQAVKTSPNSAYALMMLGAKLPDPEDGAKLFRQAYAIDSTEKYLNYYYGAMLQYQDSILQSEPYLLKEKERSDYWEVDFMLARVAVEKGDLQGAISYLRSFLDRSPRHVLGNENLLRLYIETNNGIAAREQAMRMEQIGIPVPEDLKKLIGM